MGASALHLENALIANPSNDPQIEQRRASELDSGGRLHMKPERFADMIDDDLAHTAEALAAMRAEVERLRSLRLRNLDLLLWPSPSPSLH